MKRQLNDHLLTFILYFQARARHEMRTQALHEAVDRMIDQPTTNYPWFKILSNWFMAFEYADLFGIKRNEDTFDKLYHLTMVSGIPDEWMNALHTELHKFTVDF